VTIEKVLRLLSIVTLVGLFMVCADPTAAAIYLASAIWLNWKGVP
jgi:hypothetical protein